MDSEEIELLNHLLSIDITDETTLKKELLYSNDLYLNKILNNINDQSKLQYLIYNILTCFELRYNDDINCFNFEKYMGIKYYSKYIALNYNQFRSIVTILMTKKLKILSNKIKLIDEFIEIFNYHQLYYMNFIFEKFNFNLKNSEYLYPYTLKFNSNIIGKRDKILSNKEIEYDYFINDLSKYNEDNMFGFIVLSLLKIFGYNRVSVNNQSNNIDKLRDLVGVITTNESIETIFRNFLNILDDNEICLVGI